MKPVTRSSNTRKSKHLTGKINEYYVFSFKYFLIRSLSIAAIFNPSKASDPSESETDGKQSKSPVKRTKGKVPNSKINSKLSSSVAKTKAMPVVEERKCPVEHCNSMGHLGGLSEKHFTQEACPFFHNVSLDETKKRREERLKHEDERKKATILFDPMSNVTTIEQKAFQLKIAEMRDNFEPKPPICQTLSSIKNSHQQQKLQNGECQLREPNLKGYVTDYDMKLFQEAQAVASEKVEGDLLKWPAERGTK